MTRMRRKNTVRMRRKNAVRIEKKYSEISKENFQKEIEKLPKKKKIIWKKK